MRGACYGVEDVTLVYLSYFTPFLKIRISDHYLHFRIFNALFYRKRFGIIFRDFLSGRVAGPYPD